MSRYLCIFLMVSFFLFCAVAEGATLVNSQRPSSTIVIPDNPSVCTGEAAALIQKTLAKMSGITLSIKKEGIIKGRPSEDNLWISVGNTQFALSEGIEPQSLKPEEILLIVKPAYVIIIGNETPTGEGKEIQYGTYYAAVELLERLGVRWLWPGELGEVIPQKDIVTIDNLDYRFTPKFIQRHLRFHTGLEPVTTGEFIYQTSVKQSELGPGDWDKKMRLGYSRRTKATHSFGDWYEKYFKDHPEYFAVGEDGKTYGWINNTKRSKQCTSNPGTLKQLVSNIKTYYKSLSNPVGSFYSLSINDNSAGFCMCKNCQAMDAMDGSKVTWNFNWPKEGTMEWSKKRTQVHHVSLTDRHVKFWNKVAESLENECPHLMFGAYAYSVYRAPPLHVNVHKNIVIGYVGGCHGMNEAVRRSDIERWEGWSKKVPKLMLRPNHMRDGWGFPFLWPKRLSEDIKYFASHNMVASDIANIHGHWSTQGLNYYVLCKMLWDPSLDPDKIIQDYCTAGFGKGAEEIKKYYYRLIELADKFAAHEAKLDSDVDKIIAQGELTEDEEAVKEKRIASESAWEVIFTPEILRELEGYLNRALDYVADEEIVRKRVDFLKLGFEYAPLELKVRQNIARVKRSTKSETARFNVLKALVDAEEWRKKNSRSNAIGVVIGRFWWVKGLEGTGLKNFTAMIKPEKVSAPPDKYKLTILAFSSEERIAKMQLGYDGNKWMPEEPYAVEKEWQSEGNNSVYVRFYLEGEKESKWSKTSKVNLESPPVPGK